MDVTRQKWGTRRGRGNCSLNPEVFVIELFLRDVLIYAFWKVSKSVKQERSAVKSPGSFTRFISVRNFSTAKIDRFAFVDVHHPRSLPDIFSKVSAADASSLSLSLSSFFLLLPLPFCGFSVPIQGKKSPRNVIRNCSRIIRLSAPCVNVQYPTFHRTLFLSSTRTIDRQAWTLWLIYERKWWENMMETATDATN